MYATETVDQILSALGTSQKGLTEDEVATRRAEYGFNELPEHKKSLFLIFLKQFHSILVYILFAALLLSIVLPLYEHGGELGFRDFLDAIVIAAILVLNAILGFVQEKKAEGAISSLRKLSEPMVRVRREDVVTMVPSRELIPGDIMLLEEGDRVSADGRIIFARNAKVNESSLTGESSPSKKTIDALDGNPEVSDQVNMVFKGTIVTAGRMEVCVTGIGLQTELGKVAELVISVEHPPTPLEKSMSSLGRWLGIVVLAFCGVIFVVGVIRKLPIGEMLLAAASLAVSAVPEGLPAIVTVCLAIGVQRMIKRKALTRELQAIETLGSVTVICTDKTGTITENEMSAQEIVVFGDGKCETWQVASGKWPVGSDGDTTKVYKLLLQIGASCNNAHSLEIGDPTEIGLLKAAEDAGVERLEILDEDVPFSSDSKYMMTSHRGVRGVKGDKGDKGLDDSDYVKYIKGAPEVVVDMCDLSDGEKEEILKKNDEMASNALRVLAMAYKDEGQTKFAGLIGLMDPPRDGVKEAIRLAKKAGIRTVMITGDHALTANAIADRVGIDSEVVLGKELSDMPDDQLNECVKTVSIFARVSPVQKVRILDALQRQGEIVAMGGDGVNDAPALKKAHVGFAMGKRGTDVARDTAEMVLTDDHFASVVSAIEEGRTIYDNIRKFVVFLLRANFDELAVILGAIVVGLPLPYLPIHILLVNLMTDSLPAMALALEKPEPNVMRRPPRKPGEHILSGEIGFIVLAAAIATFATFHVFLTGLRMEGGGIDLARSMAVTTSMLFELTLVFTCRSSRSLLSIGIFSNRYLLGAVGIAFAMILVIMYTPLASLFYIVPLSLGQWVLPILWGMGALIFFEVLKVAVPRKI